LRRASITACATMLPMTAAVTLDALFGSYLLLANAAANATSSRTFDAASGYRFLRQRYAAKLIAVALLSSVRSSAGRRRLSGRREVYVWRRGGGVSLHSEILLSSVL